MSDARWLDIQSDIDSSVRHFRNALAIHAQGLSQDEDLEAYKGRMAFMQAMQAGYSSLEQALERILETIEEERPTSGRDYHAQLIRRVSREIPGERPAIVEGELLRAIDEARRFRHVARKGYDDFEAPRTSPAIAAASVIVAEIGRAIAAFRSTIDRR